MSIHHLVAEYSQSFLVTVSRMPLIGFNGASASLPRIVTTAQGKPVGMLELQRSLGFVAEDRHF
jgi:hypothetical protein